MQLRGMINRTQNAIALVVSLSIVFYPMPVFAIPSFPDSFESSSPVPTRDSLGLTELPRINVDEIDTSMWELEGKAYEIAEEFAASRYRFDETVEALNYEATDAFYFVRDSIRFDPYVGILRDADGTLGGRAGNAYDRSLLLKKLLEDMGYEARLAFGTLDSTYARKLLETAIAPVRDPDDILPLAQLAGFSSQVRARMSDRAKRDFTWLNGALGSNHNSDTGTQVRQDAVRSHVWIQAKLSSNWEDLDTSFPDAEPGNVFAKATKFADAAIDGDRHVVQIKVIAETLEDGRLVEHELLQHQIIAADATRARTYLTFTPRNAGLGGSLANALAIEKDLIPALVLDGEIHTGIAIPGVVGRISESKEFLLDASQTQLSGFYLDIRVGPLDSLGSTSRAVLMDRLPSVSRKAGNSTYDDLKPMLMNDNKPEELSGIHQIMVSNGGSNPRTASADVGLAFYFVGEYLTAPDAMDTLPMDSTMWPTAMFRNAQIALNERLLDLTLNDRSDMRFFIGEPRVYLMGLLSRPSGEDTHIGMSVDLLHDPIHAVATLGASAKELFNHRLWHGVVQSSFETTLVELPKSIEPDAVEYILSASTESTGRAVSFTDSRDPRLPDVTPHALRQDLEEGNLVVTSSTSFDKGLETWWSIGADGTTRAMVEPSGGYGVSMWDGFRNLKLPKGSLFNKPTNIPSIEWHDQYAKNAKEARNAYRKEAVRRTKNSAPKTRKGGGNIEYGIVLEVSLYSAVGAGGIFALILVALLIAVSLYVLGYVWIMERQRRERGY